MLGEKTRSTALAAHTTYQDSAPLTTLDAAPGGYWLLVKSDTGATVAEGVDTVEDNMVVAGEILVLDPVLNNE